MNIILQKKTSLAPFFVELLEFNRKKQNTEILKIELKVFI